MAIKWTKYEVNSSAVVSTRVSHEGLTLTTAWTKEVRVMSDVYCDASYCLVWNPETETAETLCLGYHFELCREFGTATVDASQEVLDKVAQETEALRLQREVEAKAAVKAAAEARRNAPELGKPMKVFKGRKVPVGTLGTVFWLRDGRAGLALDDTRDARGRYANVAWVDACHLQAA